MSYRFERDESVCHGVRRIAREQIDKAIAETESSEVDLDETVHQVRKRFKKLRGLVRLVRPALGKTYQQENRWYRDAARELAGGRDATSMIECLDKLRIHFGDQLSPTAFSTIRQELERRRERTLDDQEYEGKLQSVAGRLAEARKRTQTWTLEPSGFAAIAGGLAKTYQRGCDAFDVCRAEATAEQFHEWRKRTKYHWYHVRLLQGAWPQGLKGLRRELSRLSDLLGDEHDLAMFRSRIGEDPGRYADETTLEALCGVIDVRRHQLQEEARRRGRRIFAEPAENLIGRIEAYWHVWRPGTT